MTRGAAMIALSLALIAGSCSKGYETSVAVRVDADETIAEITDRLEIRVYGGVSEKENDEFEFRRAAILETEGGDLTLEFPVRVTLAPLDEDATREFVIRATAFDAAGNPIAKVQARSGYRHERTLELWLVLEGLCQGELCDDETTCRAGYCVDDWIDPDGLPPIGAACTISNGGVEVCDGLDNDCNGVVDDVFVRDSSDVAVGIVGSACDGPDADLCPNGRYRCPETAGEAPFCDEPLSANNVETCNGRDDDCNGIVDDVIGLGGDCSESNSACSLRCVFGSAGGNFTCAYPDALDDEGHLDPEMIPSETCNGIDDDCNGLVDDGIGAEACDTACGIGTTACIDGEQVCNSVAVDAECSDDFGADLNCNGVPDVDEPGIEGSVLYYRDQDQDGYFADHNRDGVPDATSMRCPQRDAYWRTQGWRRPNDSSGPDCCDVDSRVRPGATGWYVDQNSCGNWDYDCNNQEQKRFTSCWHCISVGNFIEGWDGAGNVCGTCAIGCGWGCGWVVSEVLCGPVHEWRPQQCR